MKFTSAVIVFIFLFISSCSTQPDLKDDKELTSLVKAIMKHDNEMQEKREKRRLKGIRKLDVTKYRNDFLVTAELDNAPVSVVIPRLFNASGIPYSFDKSSLYGNTTVRFQNLPFITALNLILEPVSLNAVYKNKTVLIQNKMRKDKSIKSVKLALKNIDIETASSLLEGLYPADQRSINFGYIPHSNTIYLNGPGDEISRAMHLLMKADQKIPHVVIEVLVIEFAKGALEELGARIEALQDGKFDGSLDYGGGGSAITFNRWLTDTGEYNDFLTSFRSAIDILVSDNKARLISRPYISTLSGKEAAIEIASDRYLLVDKENGVSAAEPVTSGVILKIVPTVMSDERLRMQVLVEDSQFSRINIEGISTEVNKNAAHTVMQVEDGQTIVIGGLVSNRRAYRNTGFPWLRNVPVLNIFFGNRSDETTEKEVSIYVTPHIWTPNKISPIIEPDALTTKEGRGMKSFIRKYK